MIGCSGRVIHDVIAVDCWRQEDLQRTSSRCTTDVRLFFLSHLHADHIVGLNSSWSRSGAIYTSPGNFKIARHFLPDSVCRLLVPLELGVVHELPLGVDGVIVRVGLIDANHVHGAVMFVFQGFFGHVLYTSDFRFNAVNRKAWLASNPLLKQIMAWEDLDELYLDNTFCDPASQFPSRQEVMERIKDWLDRRLAQYEDFDILVGCQKLGKEAAYVDIAKHLNRRMCVDREHHELFADMGLPDVFTTDSNETNLKLISKRMITRSFMKSLERPSVALILTSLLHGWNEKTPQPYGDHKDFNLFYFEYSDHSSYSDLVSFVKVVKPKKVIPLIESTKETGILAKRTSFLNQRVNMNVFKTYLSDMPEKEPFWHPRDYESTLDSNEVVIAKPRLPVLKSPPAKRVYRGKMGVQYETTTTNTSGPSTSQSIGSATQMQNQKEENGEPPPKAQKVDNTSSRIVTVQGDGSVSTGEKSEGKKTPKESVMEKRNHSDNLSFIDDPPEIVCKNTPQGIASAEDTEFLEGTSETNSSFRKRAELRDSMDKENMRNDVVNKACDETGDTIDQRCLPPPASSRGTTFLQNISRAFGRVCSAMLRSPDERTLNPGTLETIEDSLDDLESHLSICSG